MNIQATYRLCGRTTPLEFMLCEDCCSFNLVCPKCNIVINKNVFLLSPMAKAFFFNFFFCQVFESYYCDCSTMKPFIFEKLEHTVEQKRSLYVFEHFHLISVFETLCELQKWNKIDDETSPNKLLINPKNIARCLHSQSTSVELDCTFKTNSQKYSLVQIHAVSGSGSTIPIALAFLDGEGEEHWNWLESLISLDS
jgi:hypothetical protein